MISQICILRICGRVRQTSPMIQSLNDMQLGDRYLVQRTSVGAKPSMPNLPYDQFPETSHPLMPAGENSTMDARVPLMLNMVTLKISSTARSTGQHLRRCHGRVFSIGPVQALCIHRPVNKDKTKFSPGDACFQSVLDARRADEAAGISLVYVKLINAWHAQSALKALRGHRLQGINHCDDAK